LFSWTDRPEAESVDIAIDPSIAALPEGEFIVNTIQSGVAPETASRKAEKTTASLEP
jgi:hypothetical protein